jgi:hypothetical protein
MLKKEISCTRVLLDRVLEHLNENIENMTISFSNISSLNLPQFNTLKILKTLTMSNNVIKEIDSLMLSSMQKLIYLDFSNNIIESIHQTAFAWQRDLRNLNLKGNRISYIHQQLFYHNTKLIFLDLSDNFIQSIDTSTFDNNDCLCWVNLERNPLILPSNWNLFLRPSLNTLEIEYINTDYVMISLLYIPELSELMHKTSRTINANTLTSYHKAKKNIRNCLFLEEKSTLNGILLNKLNKKWDSKGGTLLHNTSVGMVTFFGNPLFCYCSDFSVWIWCSEQMIRNSTFPKLWRSCKSVHTASVSNSSPTTMFQMKISTSPFPMPTIARKREPIEIQTTTITTMTTKYNYKTRDATGSKPTSYYNYSNNTTGVPPTAIITATNATYTKAPYITELPSLDKENNITNLILYVSIPVAVVCVIVIVVIIMKIKRSREELGCSSAHYEYSFYFFSADPRYQNREISQRISRGGDHVTVH